MIQELKKEFEEYLQEISEENGETLLSGVFAEYTVQACMQDNPQKKTFLLKNKKGRNVLCKYASGDYKKMLTTENELTAAKNFSFFPYVIDYLETEEEAIFLREYIEGRTLSEMIEEDGPLKLEDALPIIKNICLSLMRLHAATPALIHRDLKPSNIVLSKSGECYLVDMGTLRQYQAGNASDTFCMGTAEFAAPEQFGVRQTDVRTDIYGLGLLFYYLLTGKSKIQKEALAKMPRKVSALIQKCTAFNPDDRYNDIHQVYQELTKGLESKKENIWSYIATGILSILVIALLLILMIPKTNIGNPRVDFSSPLLEQAVRQELNKKDNEPVYRKELDKIHRLEICGTVILNSGNNHIYYSNPHHVDGEQVERGDISDISILAQMPNLKQLKLDYQEITDITPLERLPLESVSLAGNPLRDLTPLSNQTELYELDISYTKVASLAPLTACQKLRILYFTETPVYSIEPLSNMNLIRIYMRDTAVRDFQPLETIPVEVLECNRVSENSMNSIRKLQSLYELHIYSSNIVSLKVFEGMDNLTSLALNFNSLQTLDGVNKLPNLSYLSIADNPISDGMPLRMVKTLDISNTAIRDYSFLKEMPALSQLYISNAQAAELEKEIPKPWFEIRYNY